MAVKISKLFSISLDALAEQKNENDQEFPQFSLQDIMKINTQQYMLYRYIAVSDYNNVLFADYSKAYLFAKISGGLGIATGLIYFIKNKKLIREN